MDSVICVCVCIYMYKETHVCIHMYTHREIQLAEFYICTYTHMCTYIHTYVGIRIRGYPHESGGHREGSRKARWEELQGWGEVVI